MGTYKISGDLKHNRVQRGWNLNVFLSGVSRNLFVFQLDGTHLCAFPDCPRVWLSQVCCLSSPRGLHPRWCKWAAGWGAFTFPRHGPKLAERSRVSSPTSSSSHMKKAPYLAIGRQCAYQVSARTLKKGNKSTPANYRPVLLTCILYKTMEHVVCSQTAR